MSATLINCFEVPVGADEEFRARWEGVNDYMRTKDGYLGHRLHRSLGDDARYRYVNVAFWSSAEACRAAHDAGFRTLLADPGWARFPSTPAVFEVVHAGGGEPVGL